MKLSSLKTQSWKKAVLWTGLAVLIGLFVWQIKKRIHIIGPAPVITYPCTAAQSAMQGLLLRHTTTLKDTSFGRLVIAIDDYEQGDGKYWLYTVNSQEATTGADAYICVGTETISWELR